ncbi:hypothetical protein Trco_001491 [Trichoderma cornu-damae]|uniref:Uncharacterized protein n=1 Tax=Trichoderma cornu-damae TaxID=654480 RepID=A0A9P8QSF6_9HYPO|nr:hypothetical protein Trco_001491 [Trichoderma cornu-damae]
MGNRMAGTRREKVADNRRGRRLVRVLAQSRRLALQPVPGRRWRGRYANIEAAPFPQRPSNRDEAACFQKDFAG